MNLKKTTPNIMNKSSRDVGVQLRDKIINKIYIVFLLVAMLWSIVIVDRGIDMSDMGYSMAKYKYALENASSMKIGMFLSNIFCGIIYNILPSHHLLVFKLLNVAIQATCILLTFYVFKDLLEKNILCITLMIASFLRAGTYAVVTYTGISVLFLVIALFFVYKGIKTEKYIYPFLAGLTIGISVLFRLPNVLFASLYIVFLWNDIINDKKSRIAKDTLSMFLGGLTGVLLTLAVTLPFVGLDGIFSSVDYYAKSASTSTNNHSLITMIKNFYMHFRSGIKMHIIYCASTGAFAIALLSVFTVRKKKGKNLFSPVTYILMLGAIVVATVITLVMYKSYLSSTIILAAISMPVQVFSVIYFIKKNKMASMVSLMTLCVSVSIPIGSDNGIYHHLYVIFWLLPYFVYIAYKYFGLLYKKIENTEGKPIVLCAALSLLLVVSFNTLANVSVNSLYMLSGVQYREQKYTNLTYHPKANELQGVSTSESHGLVLDGVKGFLSDKKYSEKSVLALNHMPMIYTVIDNKNFLGQTYWADLDSVPIEKLEDAFDLSKSEDKMPIIVIRYLNFDESLFEKNEKVLLAEKFMKENNYSEAKSETLNGEKLYSIYIPQDVIR